MKMAQISDFQGLVTLTLDRAILHTVMRHSSTSTYITKFHGRTDGHLRPTLLGRFGGVDLIKNFCTLCNHCFDITVLVTRRASTLKKSAPIISRRSFLGKCQK